MGKQYVSLTSCHSTNDIALQMAGQNLLHDGAVIHAIEQIKGRGQRGNEWRSEAGKNLTFSILTIPKFLRPASQFELNRIVSLSLLHTLDSFLSVDELRIKWPNDIYIGEKKIAGILIENTLSSNSITKSIIGIGLNVNQQDNLLENATSMIESGGQIFNLTDVLDKIVSNLEFYYLLLKRGNLAEIHVEYDRSLYRKDIEAPYNDRLGDFKGRLQAVEVDGTLVIKDVEEKMRRYQFKEVKFL
jgi:BirA family biotin operon repressor/biotin-[acetyl-CoA-carboxylase] ligase